MNRTINYYILLTLLFSLNNIIGQVKITGNINYPPEEYKEIKLDNSKQNIYYNYTHLENPNDKSKIQNSITVLQIGTKNSKFVDLNTLKVDSLQKKFSTLKNIGTKEINQQINLIRKVRFKKDVLKDFQNRLIIFQGKVHSTKYEYEKKTPNLNWELKKENKSILNYNTKKATINYGGRKWIAWYTEEIPINLGPYVFGNLPGLILELYDDERNFHFLTVGIDNKEQEIYKRIEKKIVKTTKKDFLKAERNFHEKPELFIRGMYKGVGKLKKIPYNPIEIID